LTISLQTGYNKNSRTSKTNQLKVGMLGVESNGLYNNLLKYSKAAKNGVALKAWVEKLNSVNIIAPISWPPFLISQFFHPDF